MKNEINRALAAKKKFFFMFCLFSVSCITLMTSCNVTRVVETKSEYFTKGDTTCTIITKTVESYDASKKAPY